MNARTLSSALLLLSCAPLAISCQEQGLAAARQSTPAAATAAFQTELLDLAFAAVSMFPDNPHIKNRCRAQEAVVQACIRLDQVERAARFAAEISNWQRGAAYASLAVHQQSLGRSESAARYMALAEAVIADGARLADGQTWRIDLIRARLSRCLLLRDELDRAQQMASKADPKELAPLRALHARKAAKQDFDALLAALDTELASGEFALVQSAFAACLEVYAHSAETTSKRQAIAQRVQKSYQKLPVSLRISNLCGLAEADLAQGRKAEALVQLELARSLSRSAKWLAEESVPMRARLARLFHAAGKPGIASEELDSAEKLYQDGLGGLADMFRAGTLRPLAEAYLAVGMREKALACYRRVIAAGVQNPNSRPRAIDLAETCCSLAEQGLEPGPELWQRLRSIAAALGKPW